MKMSTILIFAGVGVGGYFLYRSMTGPKGPSGGIKLPGGLTLFPQPDIAPSGGGGVTATPPNVVTSVTVDQPIPSMPTLIPTSGMPWGNYVRSYK